MSIFTLEALLLFAMPAVGYRLDLIWGPLIASGGLFFVPSLLLGCLSPFAISLQKKQFPTVGIGTLSGEIFFWSTLGSILGSVASGFVLIPRFGTHTLLLGVGSVLVMLGLAGLVLTPPRRMRTMTSVLLLVLFLIPPSVLSAALSLSRQPFLFLGDGRYERLAVFDGVYEGRPVRFLQQDRSSSSAMFLDSDELVFDYTKYYALASLTGVPVRDALVLGAGAFSVPKALRASFPDATIDVVDVEPRLEELAQAFFRLKDDSRMNILTADARRFLLDPPRTYDVIFSDIYSSLYSLPAHAVSREFFQRVRAALKPDGIVIANVIGSLSREEPSVTFSLMRTFRDTFDQSYFLAVNDRSDRAPQNIIFVGVNGERPLDLTEPSLSFHLIDPSRYDLSAYPLFTDTYAPVENATQKLFSLLKMGNQFSGDEALALIRQQVSFGPRFLGSPGHVQMQEFLTKELRAFTDTVVVQEGREDGVSVRNIIASFASENTERVILATHYDTNPVPQTPGANNGASGVAVLLELARVLAGKHGNIPVGIDLVFFDGEEGREGVQSDTWRPLGSEYFAAHLDELYKTKKPWSAIVIDMVCEKGLRIEKERSSAQKAPDHVDAFWENAQTVAPNVFLDTTGIEIRDDHTALQQAGIPSLLAIDFEYPWIYSLNDTPDKCGAESLQSVGNALFEYITHFVK